MKLALVLALAPDRRSGRVLSGLMPAHDAIAIVKTAINSGNAAFSADAPVILDPHYPILLAIPISSVLREHRFSPTAEQLANWQDGTIREATADDLAGALEESETKLEDAAQIIKDLNQGMLDEKAMKEATGKALTEAQATIKDATEQHVLLVAERDKLIAGKQAAKVIFDEQEAEITALKEQLAKLTTAQAPTSQPDPDLRADSDPPVKPSPKPAEPPAKQAKAK